ncbi:serine hydrolase domain-containing protein [Agromyces ramosus]|uniref:CubicO group peptidase (Beta-lactamase class C family) n=1 Tax=Agromyces ramosus TaxID=33879 RepID=A0ABU0R6D5_9MICO|nr:serine hydrolase domain-containing protein [Agromyces ramosus]MDQ0893287.1 CubicO group peptidase (beta-lactamase class C family) [Agromyces ramosus]
MHPVAGILQAGSMNAPPAFSGAVVLAAVDGAVEVHEVAGRTVAWADAERRVTAHGEPVDAGTYFDLASITKVFTAAALLAELDRHGQDAEFAVAEVLPEFRDGPARAVTVRHLLTHTAGFAAEWLDRRRDADSRRRFRITRPIDAPGEVHRYSCVGYIWAGLAAEALSGLPLDHLIARHVTRPLGLADTMFRPPAALRSRIAATEVQHEPDRGLVHGEVHDETAWALDGASGNAGLFSTAGDLLRVAELFRSGGAADGEQVLPAWVVEAMTTADPRVPSPTDGYGQALGMRVDEEWMGGLRVPGHAVGHTGFTGTSMATQPGGRRSLVFLANRVHPSRTSTEIFAMRRSVADAVSIERGPA